MFTGGSIWILTHGHLDSRAQSAKSLSDQSTWLGICSPLRHASVGSATNGFATGRTAKVKEILWMDEILHHFETMGHHCLLVFTGESSFLIFVGVVQDFVHPQ